MEDESKYYVKPQGIVSKFLLSPARPYLSVGASLGSVLLVRLIYPWPLAPNTLGSHHLVWYGINSSITMMEAWVKFQAPTVKREQALDVGRHVFSALNTAEIVFAGISVYLAYNLDVRPELKNAVWALVGIVYAEGFVLIPMLAKRINAIIRGETPPRSPLHSFDIALTVLKLGLLYGSWYLQ